MLERSAASWSARAELLERIELGIVARPHAVELAQYELAEDARFIRS